MPWPSSRPRDTYPAKWAGVPFSAATVLTSPGRSEPRARPGKRPTARSRPRIRPLRLSRGRRPGYPGYPGGLGYPGAPAASELPAPGGLSGPADYAPADVMAVRRLFEPTAMSLVVAWATARDFAEMDRCLRGGERAADHDEFEVWDAALHRSIIAATRSPLLIRLYSEVERARHGRMWGDLKRRNASAARRDDYRRDHEEIVAALRLRDADGATTAMRNHLARVSRHLLGTG